MIGFNLFYVLILFIKKAEKNEMHSVLLDVD